jgi:hypothetical protein
VLSNTQEQPRNDSFCRILKLYNRGDGHVQCPAFTRANPSNSNQAAGTTFKPFCPRAFLDFANRLENTALSLESSQIPILPCELLCSAIRKGSPRIPRKPLILLDLTAPFTLCWIHSKAEKFASNAASKVGATACDSVVEGDRALPFLQVERPDWRSQAARRR